MEIEVARKISVVMPVKDRFDLASLAIYSVLNQKVKIYEIVIVDDASTIPAQDALKSVLEHAKSLCIKVIVIRNDSCKGVSAARNAGFQYSSGEIVCFCDSDDFWIPQKTLVVSDIFANCGVSVCYHSFYWDFKRLLVFRALPFGRLIKLPRILLLLFGFLNPSCCSLKREVFGEGFNHEMRYHEDLEFVLRLSKTQRIWFFNFPLTFMGRVPGSEDGATFQRIKMREGAILALSSHVGMSFEGALAALKITFHRMMLKLGR